MLNEKTAEQTTEIKEETVQEQLAKQVKTCAIEGEGCKEIRRKFCEAASKLNIPMSDLFDEVFGLVAKS
jgi:hypothetical protein